MTKKLLHLIAGSIALFLMSINFASTILMEAFGNHATIAILKQAIVYELPLLISIVAITGMTGALMTKSCGRQQILNLKIKRLIFIGVNGLFILTPCAFYLNHLAQLGYFGHAFFIAQTLELIAGATNIFLMLENLKDGLRISASYLYIVPANH